jgi:hypothetical protein
MTDTTQALEALASEAETLHAEAPEAAAGQAAPEAAPPLTNAQIMGGAIAAARSVFCAVTKLESPNRVLDDATAQRLGAAWGPVLDKYGVNLNDTMGAFMVEITAALVTLEIGLQVRAAVSAELAARNAKPIEPEPAPMADGAGI